MVGGFLITDRMLRMFKIQPSETNHDRDSSLPEAVLIDFIYIAAVVCSFFR